MEITKNTDALEIVDNFKKTSPLFQIHRTYIIIGSVNSGSKQIIISYQERIRKLPRVTLKNSNKLHKLTEWLKV